MFAPSHICPTCNQRKPANQFHPDDIRDTFALYECQECEQSAAARRQAARRDALRDKLRNDQAIFRTRHPDKIRTKNRQDYHKHNEERRLMGAVKESRRRAKLKGNGGSHTAADVSDQFIKQHGCCYYCGQDLQPRRWHVDHMLPISRGGTDNPDNLVCACAPCNLKKNNMTADEFFDKIKSTPRPL